MTYDEFKSLSEDEQRASYIESSSYDDLEAEKNSFKTENEKLTKQLNDLQEEMRKTKELNFTLSRKLSVEPKRSAEEILNELFK